MIAAEGPPRVPPGVDPMFIAITRFNRRDYPAAIALCTQLLEAQPYDQAAWFLKTRALTMAVWIDDVEVDEEGIADALLDDNATASMPRPGTSLARPMTGTAAGGVNASVRPTSASGRPTTGFARPGTQSARPGTQSRGGTAGLAAAMGAGRLGTAASRPMTSFGRLVRLGTASLGAAAGADGPFIVVERLDLRKYAERPALARALFEYLLYHDHNAKKVRRAHGGAYANVWRQRLGLRAAVFPRRACRAAPGASAGARRPLPDPLLLSGPHSRPAAAPAPPHPAGARARRARDGRD